MRSMKAFLTLLMLVGLTSGGILAPAFGADDCVLDNLSSSQNGQNGQNSQNSFAPQIRREIQEGCSVTAEASQGQCCKKANDFLVKNPIPCDSKRRLRYQINLALTVCNKVSGGSSACIEEMAYGINDPKIKEMNDSCDSKAQAVYNKDAGAVAQYPALGALAHPVDPQVDHDVSFADCQEAQLKNLRKQLDSELELAQADVASCEQTAQENVQSGANFYPIVPTGIDPSTREPSAVTQESKR